MRRKLFYGLALGCMLAVSGVLTTACGKEQDSYTISYDANGGSGTMTDPNSYESGQKFTVLDSTFNAPLGKVFKIWNDEADGTGTEYVPGKKYIVGSDLTLFAQWRDNGGGGGGEDPLDQEYVIKVNVPGGVTYNLSKTKAKKGEDVTLTLNAADGITINNVSSSQVSLVKSGDSYSFTMPNQSVIIKVEATISGNVIINGETFNAKLEDPEEDGLWVAKNVAVPGTSARSKFSFVVGGQKIDSIRLDECRCNADVESTAGSSTPYALSIAGGMTYDFYYDTNSEYSCYVIRRNVDVLPTTSAMVYNLFDGRMRSEPTCHPADLTSIHYETESPTEKYSYDYKKFSDTESFAVATDTFGGANNKYYVYKKADLASNVYEVVNTYPKAKGNNENEYYTWELDPYGKTEKTHQAFSAKLDIMPDSLDDSDIYKKHNIMKREALRNISAGAHYGKELEYEIWQSYRGDFDGSAVINAANAAGSHIDIVSTTEAKGFKTVIDSQLEYNRDGGGSSTADVEQHDAYIFHNEMHFNKAGDLVSMDYTETYYKKNEWDFSAHKPMTGFNGTKKTIKVTNGYDEVIARDLGGFNPSDYFISNITSIVLENSATQKTSDASKSYLGFGDEVELIEYGTGGEYYNTVKEFSFTPATALDAWQYNVTNVGDTTIVNKTPQGRIMTCGAGDTTITYTNGTTNAASVNKVVNVNVSVHGEVARFYQNMNVKGYDSYMCDNSTEIVATAGKTSTYWIDATYNTGAPVTFKLKFVGKNEFGDPTYSDTSEYIKSYSVKPNVLTIDCDTEASNKLTSSVSIKVKVISDYPSEKWGATDWNLTIKPGIGDLRGTTWRATWPAGSSEGVAYGKEIAEIHFNQEEVSTGVYSGYVTDVVYDVDNVSILVSDRWDFTFKLKTSGDIVDAKITAVQVNEEGFSKNIADYNIYFGGLSSGGKLAMALSYFHSDYDGEEYYDFFGELQYYEDAAPDILSYTGFSKVTA